MGVNVQMDYAKDVDVKVWAAISVTVSCDDCGEQLEIAHIESGGKYDEGQLYVTVKAHKCEVIK